eukprot:937817-Amphidinium_carterae.1
MRVWTSHKRLLALFCLSLKLFMFIVYSLPHITHAWQVGWCQPLAWYPRAGCLMQVVPLEIRNTKEAASSQQKRIIPSSIKVRTAVQAFVASVHHFCPLQLDFSVCFVWQFTWQ